jgi:cobalt-zinc-cadmium efflux system outer membrane protein
MPSSLNHRVSVRLRLCLLTIWMCLGSVPGASAAGLTLPDLIRMALQDNRDLQAARFAEQKARARLLQAGLRPNPRLELTSSNDVLFSNEGEYAVGVGVSQQFPVAGRIARQKDVARADVDLALAEIQEAERRLAGAVVSARFRLLALERQIAARDRLIGIDQNLAGVSQRRYQAAEVSELDTNAVQLDLQRLVQERTLLQSERTVRMSELNQLLGRAATEPINLDETTPALNVPALEDQQRLALEHRPDLRQSRLTVARSGADQALARAERWEDWTVSVGVDQSRLVLDNAPSQRANRALGLSVSVPLPLFNKNQGRIAEAVASEAQADAQVNALELTIRNEVASAHQELTRLAQLIADYEQHTLPVVERNIALAQRSYAQGLISIVEVVQAQRQQADLQITYLATFDQYLQALARLYTATAVYPE